MQKTYRRPNKASKTNVPMVIFATFLVVVGIALDAYFSSQKPPATPLQTTKATASQKTPATPLQATGPALLLQNADAVTILGLDGKTQRLSLADFKSQVAEKYWPTEGSQAANGSVAYFLAAASSDSRQAFLNSDRSYTAALGIAKADGASVIEVAKGSDKAQQLVLRDKNGKPLSDASLLGWLDANSLVVSAVATTTRAAYTLNVDGNVRYLSALPDNVVYEEARAGAIWYATAQLGQGLESEPQGPSELHRVTADGADLKVARDALRVFLVAVPSGADKLMYMMDDGAAYYQTIGGQSSRTALGKRRPLAFLPDGRLALRDNYDVVAYDPANGQVSKLGALPEGEVKVFVAPALDLIQPAP